MTTALTIVSIVVACGRSDGASSGTLDSAPWLWGRLTRGSHGVGVEILTDSDSSRTEALANGTRGGRPMEMVVWYPTAAAGLTRRPIPFAMYVDLSDGSMAAGANGRPDDARRRWLAQAMSPRPESIGQAMLDSILRSPMVAVRDAPPSTERFPVILWSTRHATPAAQSVMSEYLASHGYVVAWMQYAGVDSLRPPFDDVPPARKVATLEAHVADMQWAIHRLARHAAVDSTRVGVAAWSYSGEPATVLAQRMPEIRVLVGLSTNLFVSSYRGVDVAATIDSLPLRSGVIMLEETGAARGRPREAPAILDRLPGKSYRVAFSALSHGTFNAVEGMIPALAGVTDVHPWSLGGPVAQDGYETIARAVLALLNKTVKGAPGDGGFTSSPIVELVRHGPGRGVSAVDGTTFMDSVVMLSSGGWSLVGNYTRAANSSRAPAVLMLNKANGDRRPYALVARALARRGVASLRLDLRGEGESTNLGSFVPGVPNDSLANAHRDIVAALGWLRAQPGIDSARIAVIGASYSAEAMAVAGREGARARAYVALSPGSLSLETIDAIDTSGARWWIVRSRDERFVRDVVDSARARSHAARVTEVEGRAHGTDILMSRPTMATEIAEWLLVAIGR